MLTPTIIVRSSFFIYRVFIHWTLYTYLILIEQKKCFSVHIQRFFLCFKIYTCVYIFIFIYRIYMYLFLYVYSSQKNIFVLSYRYFFVCNSFNVINKCVYLQNINANTLYTISHRHSYIIGFTEHTYNTYRKI